MIRGVVAADWLSFGGVDPVATLMIVFFWTTGWVTGVENQWSEVVEVEYYTAEVSGNIADGVDQGGEQGRPEGDVVLG